MPFDSIGIVTAPPKTLDELYTEAKNKIGRERLAILADILEHEDFRKNWEWSYVHTFSCAVGVCDKIWGESPESLEYERLFGLPQQARSNIFYNLHLRNAQSFRNVITPKHVAKAIRDFLGA